MNPTDKPEVNAVQLPDEDREIIRAILQKNNLLSEDGTDMRRGGVLYIDPPGYCISIFDI